MFRITTLCLTLFLLPLLLPNFASADQDEKSEAAELLNLSEKIQKVLPEGWEIDIAPLSSRTTRIEPDYPVLVIRSKEKLDVIDWVVSAPPGYNPPTKKRVVEIVLLCRPFVSQEEYQKLLAQNKQTKKVRQEFVTRNLSKVPWGHKGPRPLPPSAFSPRNDAEEKTVLEYKFMWMKTKLNRLPTHHFKTLSFQKIPPWGGISNENKRQAYEKLLTDLDSILTPYEK